MFVFENLKKYDKKGKIKEKNGTRKKAVRRIKAHTAESSVTSRTPEDKLYGLHFRDCNIIRFVLSAGH